MDGVEEGMLRLTILLPKKKRCLPFSCQKTLKSNLLILWELQRQVGLGDEIRNFGICVYLKLEPSYKA